MGSAIKGRARGVHGAHLEPVQKDFAPVSASAGALKL